MQAYHLSLCWMLFVACIGRAFTLSTFRTGFMWRSNAVVTAIMASAEHCNAPFSLATHCCSSRS
jgi:hypothetical protein